ncbi:hypothetical protein ACWF99_23695 [Nocardia sp. NPDC055002]
MKVITLHWKEYTEHSAIVEVPEDFDLEDLSKYKMDTAVANLDQMTEDEWCERTDFSAAEGAEYPQSIEPLRYYQ